MRVPLKKICILAAAALLAPAIVAAQAFTHEQAVLNLRDVYHSRPDLIGLFAEDFSATTTAQRMGFGTLEDWAKRYGKREYPELLAWYGQESGEAVSFGPVKVNPLIVPRVGVKKPIKSRSGEFAASQVTAPAYVVVDISSNTVLFSRKADVAHPLASLTKLVTAMVALDRGLPATKELAMAAEDEVGGARLRVPVGTRVPARDMMYAMLVGSANNSANTISRSAGEPRTDFIAEMNRKVAEFGCTVTTFKDPAGMNPENVSTPEEVAAIALKAFSYDEIRRMTSTVLYDVQTSQGPHRIKNTNGLLTDPNNGLIVTGGKTGYLDEAGWNLAVRMRDARHPQLLVVVMGSASQTQSFRDAATLAKWTWGHFSW